MAFQECACIVCVCVCVMCMNYFLVKFILLQMSSLYAILNSGCFEEYRCTHIFMFTVHTYIYTMP